MHAGQQGEGGVRERACSLGEACVPLKAGLLAWACTPLPHMPTSHLTRMVRVEVRGLGFNLIVSSAKAPLPCTPEP